MAIAVLTTSTVSGSTSGNLVITKPTGVAVGDLLVINVGFRWSPSNPTNWPSCTGFTRNAERGVGANGINPHAGLVLLTKIADSDDVSASDYTINNPSTYLHSATMYRISWNGNNVNPIFDYSVTSPETLKRVTASTLMLMCVQTNGSGATVTNISGYTVTSGESNPTWTEVLDVSTTDPAGTYNDNRSAFAYATTTNATDVTAWAYTITGSYGVECAILAIISEPQNVSGDVSHLAVTPSIVGVTASQVNVVSDVSHLAITPTIEGIPTRDNSSTQWTNENKPSTTWTNQNK